MAMLQLGLCMDLCTGIYTGNISMIIVEINYEEVVRYVSMVRKAIYSSLLATYSSLL